MTPPSDELAAFVESRAIRWQKDRTYQQQLARESKPRIGETLKKIRERRAA